MIRSLLAAAASALFLVPAPAAAQSASQDTCAGARDIRLTNGRIVTMDARDSIVSEATIQDGRFVAVGRAPSGRLSPCTRVINLRGRTAIPGLIDNHNHIVLLRDPSRARHAPRDRSIDRRRASRYQGPIEGRARR